MQYKQMKFLPNGRNDGGRDLIEQHHRNHVLALINSQSTVNTLKPPKNHVNVGRCEKNLGPKRFAYDEISETYRRISQMKFGQTDNKEPKSFKLKESLSRKHSVQKQVETTYHRNNVNSLMNKIINIHSKSQKRIGDIMDHSRLQKRAQLTKQSQNDSINKSQWDTRCPHPLEAEWKQFPQFKFKQKRVLRPQSTRAYPIKAPKQKSLFGSGSMASLLSVDDSFENEQIQPYQEDESQPPLQTTDGFALDYTEAYSSPIVSKKPKQIKLHSRHGTQHSNKSQTIIYDQMSEKEQYSQQQLNNTYQIFDKKNSSCRNIVVPLITNLDDQKLYKQVRRIIMQMIMDYKIFDRSMISQIGDCLMQRNTWLNEDKILDICRDISKNLYGYDED